jgi:hypothetical protein
MMPDPTLALTLAEAGLIPGKVETLCQQTPTSRHQH